MALKSLLSFSSFVSYKKCSRGEVVLSTEHPFQNQAIWNMEVLGHTYQDCYGMERISNAVHCLSSTLYALCLYALHSLSSPTYVFYFSCLCYYSLFSPLLPIPSKPTGFKPLGLNRNK